MHTKCLNCGSLHITADARLIDKDTVEPFTFKEDAEVQILKNPNAFIFKGARYLKIRCDICEDCGHMMLGVAPTELRGQ